MRPIPNSFPILSAAFHIHPFQGLIEDGPRKFIAAWYKILTSKKEWEGEACLACSFDLSASVAPATASVLQL